MTVWLAGMKITADRLNDHTLEDSTNSGATASTNFTLSDFSGRKVNGITTITITCSRTNSNITETSAGNGNIADTSMATLPTGWRPPELIEAIWDSGFNDGGATISTAGVITLRTTSGSAGIAVGHNPRVSATWISENN